MHVMPKIVLIGSSMVSKSSLLWDVAWCNGKTSDCNKWRLQVHVSKLTTGCFEIAKVSSATHLILSAANIG